MLTTPCKERAALATVGAAMEYHHRNLKPSTAFSTNPEVSNRTGTSTSGRGRSTFFLPLQERELPERQNMRSLAPSVQHPSHKRSMQSKREISLRPSESRRPTAQSEGSTNRSQRTGLERGRKTDKHRRNLFAGVEHG